MVFLILVALIIAFNFIPTKNKTTKMVYCAIIGVFLIFVSGFRSNLVGTDTTGYIRTFLNAEPITWDLFVGYFSEKEFLYYIYRGVIRRFTENYTFFLLPIATFYIIAVARFIRKISHRHKSNKTN